MCNKGKQLIEVVACLPHEDSPTKAQIVDDAHCRWFETVWRGSGPGGFPEVVVDMIKALVEIRIMRRKYNAAIK